MLIARKEDQTRCDSCEQLNRENFAQADLIRELEAKNCEERLKSAKYQAMGDIYQKEAEQSEWFITNFFEPTLARYQAAIGLRTLEIAKYYCVHFSDSPGDYYSDGHDFLAAHIEKHFKESE